MKVQKGCLNQDHMPSERQHRELSPGQPGFKFLFLLYSPASSDLVPDAISLALDGGNREIVSAFPCCKYPVTLLLLLC